MPNDHYALNACRILDLGQVAAEYDEYGVVWNRVEAAVIGKNAISILLGGVRDWWLTQEELSRLDSKEIGQVAGDLGLTTGALKDLVARGPDAPHLLYERMEALGISKADVDHAAHGVLRDLQRTCAVCGEKGTCEKDLAKRSDDPVWKSYCPNAVTLQTLVTLRAQSWRTR